MRIAIIGGGITGIAAAIHARHAAPVSEVVLFESSHRLGGVIETLQEPHLIEKGADNFATLLPDALELSRLCGIEDQLIGPSKVGRQAFVLHAGKMEPIPAGFSLMQPTKIASILTTRTLSWGGKLRLLREFFVPAREGSDDESLESYVVRRLGREAFENLVEPIVSGIFTADPATLSMRATMPQFLEMERSSGGLIRGHLASKRKDAKAAARKASGARYDQFRAPERGMSAWIDALAATLPAGSIRLGQSVRALRSNGNASLPSADGVQRQWAVELGCSDSPSGEGAATEQFDAVVCATPASVTSKVLAPVDPELADSIGQINYASSAVVAMVVQRSDIRGRLDGFGMIVPGVANRKTLAISFTSNKYPGRTPDDLVLLRVFFGGAKDPGVLELSDGELEALAEQEVREILDWKGSAEWIRVIRWNRAMPQYIVGHVDRVDAIYKQLDSYPSLAVAGAAYRGVGIPQCVRSGRQAAEKVIAGLR